MAAILYDSQPAEGDTQAYSDNFLNNATRLHAPQHLDFSHIGKLITLKHKLAGKADYTPTLSCMKSPTEAYLTEEVPQPLSDLSKMHYKA